MADSGVLVAELEHVRKVYGEGDTAVTALDDLCLNVNRGEYLAVMGTSGSGKSTAMNILGCLDRPSSGSYRLNGTAVERLNDDQLADLRNRELGFVFQQFHLLQELTLARLLGRQVQSQADLLHVLTPRINLTTSSCKTRALTAGFADLP